MMENQLKHLSLTGAYSVRFFLRNAKLSDNQIRISQKVTEADGGYYGLN